MRRHLWRLTAMAPMVALHVAAAGQTSAPTLLELYQQALESNPAIQAQKASVERAQARHDVANSRLLPQISANLSTARNDFRGEGVLRDEYDSRRNSITLRQALWDPASSRQAESEASRVEQSRLELESTRNTLAEEIVDRMLDVFDAGEELSVVRIEKEAVRSQRSRLRSMFARQMTKVTDLLEVEAYYVTLEAREIERYNDTLVALEHLRESVAVDITAMRPLRNGALPVPPGELADWLRKGLQQSPRLAALRQTIEAEQRALASARAQYYPQLALTASKVWTNSDSDSRRNPPFNVASIGLQLTVPIYEGGRTDATVRDAAARESIAHAQLEESRREVEREIRTAWLKARGNWLRIDATLQSAQAQEKSRDAQERGFELGTVTVVDLLESQRRLYRSRADHARARNDYVRDLVALYRHAGRLSGPDMEAVSALFTADPRTFR